MTAFGSGESTENRTMKKMMVWKKKDDPIIIIRRALATKVVMIICGKHITRSESGGGLDAMCPLAECSIFFIEQGNEKIGAGEFNVMDGIPVVGVTRHASEKCLKIIDVSAPPHEIIGQFLGSNQTNLR